MPFPLYLKLHIELRALVRSLKGDSILFPTEERNRHTLLYQQEQIFKFRVDFLFVHKCMHYLDSNKFRIVLYLSLGVGKTEPEMKKIRFVSIFSVSVLFFYFKKPEYRKLVWFFRFGSVRFSDQTLKNSNRTDNIIWVSLFYQILV